MTEPTDADRKAAAELVAITGVDNHADAIAAIAAALAAERERARAPFLALADEWAQYPVDEYVSAAYEIRRAAEDTR